jgi:hypothetical protein
MDCTGVFEEHVASQIGEELIGIIRQFANSYQPIKVPAAEDNTDLHGDLNALHWAERFASIFEVRLRSDNEPVGANEQGRTRDFMLTWFAGAIETGRMEKIDG